MRKPVELRQKKDISEMMLETFNARRAFVKNSNPSAAIMKDEWPGLLIYDEVGSEYSYITDSFGDFFSCYKREDRTVGLYPS